MRSSANRRKPSLVTWLMWGPLSIAPPWIEAGGKFRGSEAPTCFLGGFDDMGFFSNEEDWEEWDKGESMVFVRMGLGVSR